MSREDDLFLSLLDFLFLSREDDLFLSLDEVLLSLEECLFAGDFAFLAGLMCRSYVFFTFTGDFEWCESGETEG